MTLHRYMNIATLPQQFLYQRNRACQMAKAEAGNIKNKLSHVQSSRTTTSLVLPALQQHQGQFLERIFVSFAGIESLGVKETNLNRQNAKHAARAAKGNAQKQYNAHDVRNALFGGAHRALGVL
jgi:hypothetical protein